MYPELIKELRELSYKFSKMLAQDELSLSETYKASEIYLLLLAAKNVSLGGKAEVKERSKQCF